MGNTARVPLEIPYISPNIQTILLQLECWSFVSFCLDQKKKIISTTINRKFRIYRTKVFYTNDRVERQDILRARSVYLLHGFSNNFVNAKSHGKEKPLLPSLVTLGRIKSGCSLLSRFRGTSSIHYLEEGLKKGNITVNFQTPCIFSSNHWQQVTIKPPKIALHERCPHSRSVYVIKDRCWG